MGIDIQLQNEDGEILERISDEKRLLHDLLPVGDHSLLSGIDLYGDTIFNRIQMDDFLSEWAKLKMKEMSSVRLCIWIASNASHSNVKKAFTCT